MSNQFVVSVAVPVPLRKTFDYLPSPSAPDRAQYNAGKRCVVPVGRRLLTGVILGTHEAPQVSHDRLRPIEKILDPDNTIPNPVLSLCRWISDYYHAPIGEVLLNALPPLMRQQRTWVQLEASVSTTIWHASTKSAEAKRPRGSKQKLLLELLLQSTSGMEQKDIISQGYTSAQLRSLQEKGLIGSTQVRHFSPPQRDNTNKPRLSDEQQLALQELEDNGHTPSPTLLEGITGSGKTEVYLEWIENRLNTLPSGQILVLVPEIALTPQTLRRFRARFGGNVTCYHSGLNESERLLTWMQVKEGNTHVVVATRSGILLPFKNLCGIIVDEEHDSSFKQQDNARYHARDLAIIRGQQSRCPVILGSATPSFESMNNVADGRYRHIRLSSRISATPLPKVYLIDVKSRPLEGGISPPLLQEIKSTISAGEQVMIFINRRGFAPVIMCVDCGWIAECQSCDVRLTYHRRQNLLKCHHCEKQYRLPPKCPKCESANLKPIGAGTERTEEFLEQQFPDYPVIRIDRDAIQNKGALEQKLTPIRDGAPCLIVGTQMLAKGHDFPNLTTVAVLNADGGLFSSDFRGAEKTAQLLIQVAGRAGRREKAGRVFIQTQFPDHPLLQLIRQHDYQGIYTSEMEMRRQGHFPPVHSMALIRGEAATLEDTLNSLWQMRDLLEATQHSLPSIHGPFPSLIQKKQNRFHGLIWLFSPEKPSLRKFLKHWLHLMESQKPKLSSKFRWLLDVDPIDTL
ncbi:primosomal protein N' [Hahella sp. CCB-MM4]|uniref:primosomal protein N' n=1 Tax=Hahella sp. (strain CCB-MM4) TaxID=1926491 RepID=UPI000B9A56DB|nr:primosomal protein N' [Hahella sp. CCB-MM4]OZG71430.1 primosomal protein N' [Hahella sp. CCB-MM4]